MNYREAMAYVEELGQYGSVMGLTAMRELCARLDNPQDQLKFVHIAGTNGKGSKHRFTYSRRHQLPENMPKQRLSANRHKGFWKRVCNGFETGAKSRGKNHRFHITML